MSSCASEWTAEVDQGLPALHVLFWLQRGWDLVVNWVCEGRLVVLAGGRASGDGGSPVAAHLEGGRILLSASVLRLRSDNVAELGLVLHVRMSFALPQATYTYLNALGPVLLGRRSLPRTLSKLAGSSAKY